MKTTQEKIEVMQAYVDGKTIEFIRTGVPDYWSVVHSPMWAWSVCDYRIKQVSPLIIPWDAIKPEYKWAAKDENDEIYIFKDKPSIIDNYWKSRNNSYRDCSHLIIQDPDKIYWKDSLVERPSA